jgi:hypothetical protein
VIRTAARQLTGADGATFVLRDGNHCHYSDEDAIAPLWKGLRFPLDQCISGWVMTHGIPASGSSSKCRSPSLASRGPVASA